MLSTVKITFKLITLLFLLFTLAGCGGGSSSSETIPPIIVPVIEDPPPAGSDYQYTPDDKFFELQPWVTYRGTASHTAFVPININTSEINKIWEIPFDFKLNPAIAFGEEIFLSEFEDISPETSADIKEIPSIYSISLGTGNINWNVRLDELTEVLDTKDKNDVNFHHLSYGNGLVYATATTRRIGESYPILHTFALDANTGLKMFALDEYRFESRSIDWKAVTPYKDALYRMVEGRRMAKYNALDGTLIWKIDLGGNAITQIPTVTDSRIFLHTSSGHTFMTFDQENGELVSEITWTCISPDGRVDAQLYVEAIPYGPDNRVAAVSGDCIASFYADVNKVGDETNWLHYRDEQDLRDLYLTNQGLFALAHLGTGETSISNFGLYDAEKKWDVKYANEKTSTPGVTPVISTMSHLIISSVDETIIVRNSDQSIVWSYPKGGEISLTETGVLLITSQLERYSQTPRQGYLTAVRLF